MNREKEAVQIELTECFAVLPEWTHSLMISHCVFGYENDEDKRSCCIRKKSNGFRTVRGRVSYAEAVKMEEMKRRAV